MNQAVDATGVPRATAHRGSDFLKLWGGQGVSAVGSEVTEIALPMTAVLSLHATAGQLGVLNAARWLPYLLFALVIGAYADRWRRLPLLVSADVCRAVVVALIVLSAWTSLLVMPLLIGLVFVFGTFTVLFEIAYISYLPSLVERDDLVVANSRLQATASVAGVGGPALGGLLVQLVTAPITLLADAVSFAVSVGSLVAIRAREPQPAPSRTDGKVARRIREGLRVTYRNRCLRVLVAVAASYNFFDDWILTLFMLYAVHILGFGAGAIGLVLAAGAVGAVAGSLITGRSIDRLGLGRALLVSVVVESVVLLAVPLIPVHRSMTLPVIGLVFAINAAGVSLSSVAAVTVRQSVTPGHLLGRMNASYRFISYGAVPLGAAAGGFVGEFCGLRTGLVIGALGMVTTIGWVFFSPLPALHSIDDARAVPST